MITLIIKDAHTEDSKLRFKSFNEAAAHARMTIVPQIADLLRDFIHQDDPTEFREVSDTLTDLLHELYEGDEDRVIQAVEDWQEFVTFGGYENDSTWIEWIR